MHDLDENNYEPGEAHGLWYKWRQDRAVRYDILNP